MRDELVSHPASRRQFLRLATVAGGLLLAGCAPTATPGGSSPAGPSVAGGTPQPPPRPPTRLSIATGGTGGVYYPYGGGIAKILTENVRNVTATAEVTNASIDNLKFVVDGNADIAFSQADALFDAVNGLGEFQGQKAPVQALAHLYLNYAQLVTLADRGITRVADLRGRPVSVGAPGSGTELIAVRVLEAAGLNPRTDIQRQQLAVAPSVDAIKDGKIDAFMWVGGLPTAAVLDLANTPGRQIRILALEELLPAFQQKYGQSYVGATIPAATYPGLPGDVRTIGTANILVVHQKMDETLAYEITKTLFEKQQELIAIHSEAKNLSLQNAVTGSPAPFHPGAIRFYREKGVWRG
ncbi:MAG: TAXI family TRAP transporter solute-binding subunit [Chloroflexi bacterium]|nr:TAXI family TRAP transporter solute-binding subunit [Chloroflexota bacterium]